MNEADTRAEFIDKQLQAAGWSTGGDVRVQREYNINAGEIKAGGIRTGKLIADYVLSYKNRKLAVVEAKSNELEVGEGVAQAKLYAQKLHLETSYAANGNEIYQICQVSEVDYATVKDTILLDKRIARNIDVPGPDGDLGYGGKCFPKDLNALIHLAREKKYRPYLLEEVWRLNEKVRKNKDWLDIPGATSENEDFTKD